MRQAMANAFTYSIRVDDTVRKDADEQIERLTKGLNLTAQSGYVNVKPIIAKIWSLLGENPDEVVMDPQPKAPEPVKVSVSKAEDLINPMMLAVLAHTNQLPMPQDVAAVGKLLEMVQALKMPIVPPEPPSEHPPGGPETPGIAHPTWETAPRVDRRAEDGGA
jgi:hypothetical protein